MDHFCIQQSFILLYILCFLSVLHKFNNLWLLRPCREFCTNTNSWLQNSFINKLNKKFAQDCSSYSITGYIIFPPLLYANATNVYKIENNHVSVQYHELCSILLHQQKIIIQFVFRYSCL